MEHEISAFKRTVTCRDCGDVRVELMLDTGYGYLHMACEDCAKRYLIAGINNKILDGLDAKFINAHPGIKLSTREGAGLFFQYASSVCGLCECGGRIVEFKDLFCQKCKSHNIDWKKVGKRLPYEKIKDQINWKLTENDALPST